MLKYKALYNKMTDDLKDAEMWMDWAKHLTDECPEVAKFLYTSAKERITTSFPHTKELFDKLCDEEKNGHCFKDLVEDHLLEWKERIIHKLEKFV